MNLLPEPASSRLLSPEFHERVWGSHQLEPLFPNSERKIGEVWFPEPDFPVLVKFLFTTENLSVQVHPDDRTARELGHVRGKSEMWHILAAAPSARIAVGFASPATRDQIGQAALDGSIMNMLRWVPARPGDSWFIPAGTVHAVGAGITLCEVQQNSDVTYRLFDYGRGRELHREQSLRALNPDLAAVPAAEGARVLADCPFFKVERIDVSGTIELNGLNLLIGVRGVGSLSGRPFNQGNVCKADPGERLQLTGNMTLLAVTTGKDATRT